MDGNEEDGEFGDEPTAAERDRAHGSGSVVGGGEPDGSTAGESDAADGPRLDECGSVLGPASVESPVEFVRRARALKGLDPSVLSDFLEDGCPGDGSDGMGSGPASSKDTAGPVGAKDTAGPVDPEDIGVGRIGHGSSGPAADGPDSCPGSDDTPRPDTGGAAEPAGESAGPVGGGDGAGGPDGPDGAGSAGSGGSGWRPLRGMPRVGSEGWASGSVRRGGFEPGVAGVVDALAALGPADGLDDVVLHERTVDLVRARSLLDAALTAHLRLWDARALWSSDGSKSPSARMARDANCSKGTVSASVALARGLARMPHTADAFAEGLLSVDHVRRLVDACTDDRLQLFLRDEAALVGDAAGRLAGHFAGFKRMVRFWELAADDELHDPTDPDDEPPGQKRSRTQRDFRMPETPDGFDLRGSLPKADGAIVATTLQRIYDQLWEADWAEARAEHGDTATTAHLKRTVAQRRADALVEMARRASAWRTGDAVARPLISVLVNYEDLAGPIRDTFNGTVLSRRDVAEWLTEADFERIVFTPKGQPADVTSPQRFFTGALRRAVQVRDRVCSHPTCDVDAERCQVDHIIEYNDGGPTNIDNARLLCPRHNQQRPGRTKKPPNRRSGSADGGAPDSDGQ